eukprot:886119-Alexandrium_andersonii.AAC.1
MGVSDFRRLGAAERAVWPVGRAGTNATLGWILGPELFLTSYSSDRLPVPTCEQGPSGRAVQSCHPLHHHPIPKQLDIAWAKQSTRR